MASVISQGPKRVSSLKVMLLTIPNGKQEVQESNWFGTTDLKENLLPDLHIGKSMSVPPEVHLGVQYL